MCGAIAADLAFAREYDLDESFTLEWSAGLRYASYEETTRGGYDVASTLLNGGTLTLDGERSLAALALYNGTLAGAGTRTLTGSAVRPSM